MELRGYYLAEARKYSAEKRVAVVMARNYSVYHSIDFDSG